MHGLLAAARAELLELKTIGRITTVLSRNVVTLLALGAGQRGVADSGFEPLKHEAADLQSAPFDRLGNPPVCFPPRCLTSTGNLAI